MKRILLFVCALCICSAAASAQATAEWQWSAPVRSVISDETYGHPRAFLWIPSDCRQVRAVVVGQHNMCEENIFNNPVFREKMSEAGIALVWFSPILNFPWDVSTGCNEALLGVLDDLAEVSGYSELRFAPIVPLGHSAMATFPWNFAAWNPERTLAVISYHGDAPRTNLTGYGGSNLEWGRTRNIDGIPGLMVEGEYEWWEARVTPALAFRMMYPGSCISFLCDADRGHFDISDRTVSYIALFIRKALETRLPDTVDWTRPVPLKKLNPRDGWLAERWRTGTAEPQGEVRTARLKKQPARPAPAPYSEYKGDPHDAFWYFDREMAELTEEIYRQDSDLLPQYLSFEQDGKLVGYNSAAHVTLAAQFKPEADGVTFHLKPVYTDSLRTSLSDRHSAATPRICDFYGPVRQIDDTTFAISFYRMGTTNLKRRASLTFIASAEGDSRYKGTVQEIGMTFPYPLKEGKSQHITFPAISDIGADEGRVELHATSDSALPVYYYVKEGPAEVVGNELILTKIPPRSKFPVKVTVVAWQYGVQGKVQTAEPVETSFNVYPSRKSLSKTASAASAQELRLSSPDGSHEVEFSLEKKGELSYSVSFKGSPVLERSRAGLDMDNRVWEMALGVRDLKQPSCWMDPFEVDSVAYHPAVDSLRHPLYGERSTVRDAYNSATMYLSRKDGSDYRLNVEVRAYNEGIAFRYFLPEHPKAIFHKVKADLTEYTFPAGTMAWSEQWAQARFERLAINDIHHPVERALTVELPSGVWAALTDADVDDWCLTKFIASSGRDNTLASVMYSPVDMVTYFATPWKIIMASDTPGGLLEHNSIIENLNPPCAIPDVAGWVKPGKIMRETTISTEGAIATIDFCAAHNIPYMLFDWKWYMPCTSHDGDATKVVDKLDMPRVVAYGREKGVGIWLYVNQHALMKQARELFPLLREWGIVGVKSGFVQYASHRWATWLHDLVRLAADNHLMMNIHDEFRPSGFSRTYPNLLTQEGICGNEEFPDATHNTILPFTRMINGAADYTICYYDGRLKTTHAHQLAASLVFYSPLQTIFWYDRPSLYQGEPEIEWFENLQTVWDDSRVLDGAPGENVTIARRKGEEWFVGMLTGNNGSHEEIPLNFLDAGKTYLAYIYTDGGEKVQTRTQVECRRLLVDASMTMRFSLKPSGGAALRFVPIDKKASKGYRKLKASTIL